MFCIGEVASTLLSLKEGQSSLKIASSKIIAKQESMAKALDDLRELVSRQQKDHSP